MAMAGSRNMRETARYPSRRSVAAVVVLLLSAVLLLWPSRGAAVNVLTQHNDNFRTGANLNEYVLTTSNVNTGQFGKLFARPVDGQIFAQPLYVHNVTISNQTRNVIYVCTESNSVYAFDADHPAASNALWRTGLGAPVPASAVGGCPFISPEIGITSTPVINPSNNTLYVETKTVQGTNYVQSLHALDITTGLEKFGGPVVIQGSVPGTGDGGTTVVFNAFTQVNRPGLLLLSNVVYVAFGSHCDFYQYHGWLFGYNATNLQQVAIYNTTPNGSEGAIWSCGMGPAADSNGNIYVMTGNGTFDKNTGGPDLGDSFIKFSTSNGTLAVADWFTPYNQGTLDSQDLDLGSGGAVVLPGTSFLVGVGKTGPMYLLNEDHLGGFSSAGSDTNVAEEFMAGVSTCCIGQNPVYWNGPANQFIFQWSGDIPLKAFSFNGSSIQSNAVATGATTQSSSTGGTSLSAKGNTAGSGIVWGTESGNGGTLHAYDATNVADELWNSQQNAARDALSSFVKFCAPTIVNGKVYVATSNQLVVYTLLAAPYQLWRQQNFSSAQLTNATVSGDTASPAGDGIANLTKYAFNLKPFVPVTGGLPVDSLQTIGGTHYLSITFNQVLFATDISYIVQVSGDMATWNSGPGYTAPVGTPIDNGDGTETVTVQDVVPVSAANSRFIRVQINGP